MRQPRSPITVIVERIEHHDPGAVVEIDLALVTDYGQVVSRGNLLEFRKLPARVLATHGHQLQIDPSTLGDDPVAQMAAEFAPRIIKNMKFLHKSLLTSFHHRVTETRRKQFEG